MHQVFTMKQPLGVEAEEILMPIIQLVREMWEDGLNVRMWQHMKYRTQMVLRVIHTFR